VNQITAIEANSREIAAVSILRGGDGVMKTLVAFLLLASLAAAGNAVAFKASNGAEPAVTQRSETRFAIRYCGSQYTSQYDVASCLQRLLPPGSIQQS
jgi:hypothetical protein